MVNGDRARATASVGTCPLSTWLISPQVMTPMYQTRLPALPGTEKHRAYEHRNPPYLLSFKRGCDLRPDNSGQTQYLR